MDEIKIWAIDGSSEANKVAEELTPSDWTETEQRLEDILGANPEMLMPGLTLVGRQMPIPGGILDLLGVDSNGRLVVFELKRGTLTRDAVAQIIDYASSLELLSADDLADQIAKQSGKNGIDSIQKLDALKPVQMRLVGLGADKDAARMVDFLQKRGVDILLLTFHVYSHAEKTLLAKQVQTEHPPISRVTGDGREERSLLESAETLGIRDFFEEVVESFSRVWCSSPLGEGLGWRITFKRGYSFCKQRLEFEDGKGFHTSHSVQFTEDGKIDITFFPISIHLCEEKFSDAGKTVQFVPRPPPHKVPQTQRVDWQYYCQLDRQEWEEHKDTLQNLASAVHAAWNQALSE